MFYVSERGGTMVMGDMNARTAEKVECIVSSEYECIKERRTEETVFQNTPTDSVINMNDLCVSGMSQERKNADRGTNEYGTRLLNVCQGADLLILNGRAHKDKGIGRKTFLTKGVKVQLIILYVVKVLLEK